MSLSSIPACVDNVLEWVESGERANYVVCLNPHSVMMAGTDWLFRQSLMEADVVIPDGAGVVLASKLLGGDIRRRITGSDIFKGVSAALNSKGEYRVFFLGSTEENLKRIEAKMAQDYPRLQVGSYSPPFKDEFDDADNRLMVDTINRFNPHVLWVGMTAPKQEKWIYSNRSQLNVRFIGAVGAVFDFYTGNVKRSHPLFQKFGLEWLPRLVQQPNRLWKRNLVSSPRFLLQVMRARRINGGCPKL